MNARKPLDSAMKLSKPRFELLRKLYVYSGGLGASQLTVPERGLATRMQSAGLVEWFGGASRHTCVGQFVRLTDRGRAVMAEIILANSIGMDT